LQRHRKGCNGWIVAVQSVNDNSDHEEGTHKSTEHRHVRKSLISA
jgi:hypothetical protein